MIKTKIKDIDEIKVQRLTVPYNLTNKQYIDLKSDYTDTIVQAKIGLKKAWDIHREHLSEVLSYRRKLNDAENRLIEVYERIIKAKK